MLGVLNVLFFAANTADVLYLWNGGALPDGVTYSQFVHHGVYGLIAAVVLSAILIVVIFQQVPAIRAAPAVKALSLFWILQNVVLITGVLLRLQRYVDVYDLSELRVYVGCFLLLVTTGFGLLTVHVLKHKGSWMAAAVQPRRNLRLVLRAPVSRRREMGRRVERRPLGSQSDSRTRRRLSRFVRHVRDSVVDPRRREAGGGSASGVRYPSKAEAAGAGLSRAAQLAFVAATKSAQLAPARDRRGAYAALTFRVGPSFHA